MDKTDRLRDYGLAFLLYEQGLGLCGYELIRELFIFVKLILNSYLVNGKTWRKLVFVLISKDCECYAEKDGAQLVVLVKDNAVNS